MIVTFQEAQMFGAFKQKVRSQMPGILRQKRVTESPKTYHGEYKSLPLGYLEDGGVGGRGAHSASCRSLRFHLHLPKEPRKPPED